MNEQSFREPERCTYILRKGKKKHQPCGRVAGCELDGARMCLVHYRATVVKDLHNKSNEKEDLPPPTPLPEKKRGHGRRHSAPSSEEALPEYVKQLEYHSSSEESEDEPPSDDKSNEMSRSSTKKRKEHPIAAAKHISFNDCVLAEGCLDFGKLGEACLLKIKKRALCNGDQ